MAALLAPYQRVQVRPLVRVEAQDVRDGVQHLGRGMAAAALLQAYVVVDADPGELGEFLAAQARHPAAAAEAGARPQARVLRAYPGTPRSEEFP